MEKESKMRGCHIPDFINIRMDSTIHIPAGVHHITKPILRKQQIYFGGYFHMQLFPVVQNSEKQKSP